MRRFLLVFVCFAVSAVAKDLPFPIGEELNFSVSWNGVPVAKVRTHTELVEYEGREVLAIRLKTKTAKAFNWVYKVDDFHETLVDLDTFLPIRYTKNLKEGGYRCHEITHFDFKELKAHYEHQTNGQKKTYDIEEDTRDVLSFMYFMRSQLLDENKKYNHRMMADEKIYDVVLHTYDVEDIDLDAYRNEIPSLKLYPETELDGLAVRKGKAELWLSRDPRRLLTYMKIGVPFGKARIKLQSVKGPGDDFWITDRKDDD